MVDGKIVQFIVKSGQPLTGVRQLSFVDLVAKLRPEKSVMSYPILKKRIMNACEDMKLHIRLDLAKTQYVCSTVDAWSDVRLPIS